MADRISSYTTFVVCRQQQTGVFPAKPQVRLAESLNQAQVSSLPPDGSLCAEVHSTPANTARFLAARATREFVNPVEGLKLESANDAPEAAYVVFKRSRNRLDENASTTS